MRSQLPCGREWVPHPSLGEGVVAVWRLTLAAPSAGTIARWFARLDRQDQIRADRFRFAADRETYIAAAHALARALLERVGGLPARVWRFVAGINGKPEMDRALRWLRLRFNTFRIRNARPSVQSALSATSEWMSR